MSQPYLDKAPQRNICIKYSADGTNWYYVYYYAHKIYITLEDEEIRGEKKLISGEIRVRWKKRFRVDLEFIFFNGFNQYVDLKNQDYQFFEKVINAPYLRIEYNTSIDPKCPYSSYEQLAQDNLKNMIVKEKKNEFLNDRFDLKIIKLTLIEASNWYATTF